MEGLAGDTRSREARRAPRYGSDRVVGCGRELEQFAALWPQVRFEPDALSAKDVTQSVWSEEQALVEILRGRLEGLGPVTQTELAVPLGLESRALASGLTALEVEGSVLRGRFVAGVNDEQWCDRRLLARIHHYTVRRLRSEIEPSLRAILRFLFAWHRLRTTRLHGPNALPAVLAAEGFEAPANAWETEILPTRIAKYGHRGWTRSVCPGSAPGCDSSRLPRQRPRTADHAGAGDADHLARAPPRSALVIACRPRQRCAAEPSGSNRVGSPRNPWRVVF